jgi:hypothetical protein
LVFLALGNSPRKRSRRKLRHEPMLEIDPTRFSPEK